MAKPYPFVAFNRGSLLQLAQHDDIRATALRGLPYFTGEDHTIVVDHIQDVATLCSVYNITQENVAIRLLAVSLKEKALQWFRGLRTDSIMSWDDLGDGLHKHFEDKYDLLSLLQQLSTIKKNSHKHMSDFNYYFQKTWDRIPVTVRSTPLHAFLFYLRALDSEISIMIQALGGSTLPDAFEIVVRAENYLILVGKIPPRPPLPIFLQIQSSKPMKIPILANVLAILAIGHQVVAQDPVVLAHS